MSNRVPAQLMSSNPYSKDKNRKIFILPARCMSLIFLSCGDVGAE